MIPQTRTDLFLAKITGEDVTLPEPQTRFELYLANIAGESYELPAPNSRATLYLAKILGQDVALPVPQTRSELYLASIAGMSVQLPEAPTTREEWYLARWAEDAAYVTITGNPVSFQAVAAKLRQLKIAFSPVQEGSGDPSPENERPISGWPGVNVWQAGKNLFDPSRVVMGYWLGGTWHESTWWGGVLIPCTPGTVISVSGNPTAGGVNGAWLNQHTDPTTGLVQTVNYAGVSKFTAPAGAYGLWLPLYKDDDWSALQIEYAEEPTTFETPTGSKITVSFLGKNKFTGKFLQGYWAYANGAWTASNNWIATEKIPCKPSTYYTVSASEKMTRWQGFVWYAEDGSFISTDNSNTNSDIGFTRQSPATAAYLAFNIAGYPDSSSTITPSDVSQFQLEEGQTATAYEAPTIIYSGTVDLVTGVGEINWVKDVYDGSSDEVWGYAIRETPAAFYTQITRPANNPQSMGNYLKRVTAFGAVSGFSYIIHSGQIRVSDMGGECADTTAAGAVAKLRAYLAANPFEVVHEITPPLTIQLTPQQISSLAGTNNMWTDANGDLTVEYRKDGNVSDAEALSMLLGGRYTPATGPEDVSDSEALRIISGR